MTNKKTLDTGWKRQKSTVAGIVYAIRRRVICECIGETHPPEPGRYEDVEIEMTVWSSAQGAWLWSVRATAIGAPAWEYKFLESKRPHASKTSAKREVMQVGHGIAKLIAGHTAHDSDPPGRKVLWPACELEKRPRRMQWPANDVPLDDDGARTLVMRIVEAIRQTHEIRRVPGSRSDYRGIDSVLISSEEGPRWENIVKSISEEEPVFTNLEMLHAWVGVAFILGTEQGRRVAQAASTDQSKETR